MLYIYTFIYIYTLYILFWYLIFTDKPGWSDPAVSQPTWDDVDSWEAVLRRGALLVPNSPLIQARRVQRSNKHLKNNTSNTSKFEGHVFLFRCSKDHMKCRLLCQAQEEYWSKLMQMDRDVSNKISQQSLGFRWISVKSWRCWKMFVKWGWCPRNPDKFAS